MASVTSADGTSIAYQHDGSGPAVILIGGGLDDGSEDAPLARELAAHFTVYNFIRRGRGDSGDTQPYAVEREIEDIAALIAEAGESAHVFGASSGGMFAWEAAAAGLAVGRVAVYEVLYDRNDYFEHAADAVAAILPHAERHVIEGQGHVVDPKIMAAALARFFRT
jgi:hypothetical protein